MSGLLLAGFGYLSVGVAAQQSLHECAVPGMAPNLVTILHSPCGKRDTSWEMALVPLAASVFVLLLYPLSWIVSRCRCCGASRRRKVSGDDGGESHSANQSPPRSTHTSPAISPRTNTSIPVMPRQFSGKGWAAKQVQAERIARREQYFDISLLPELPQLLQQRHVTPGHGDPPLPISVTERLRACTPSLRNFSVFFLLLSFCAVQVSEFVRQYYLYMGNPLFSAVGHGLPMARGAAGALRINCALVMLPMMHWVNSKLRGSTRIPLPTDLVRRAHTMIGFAIVFWTAVHLGAHLQNYMAVSALPLSVLSATRPQLLYPDPDPAESARIARQRFIREQGINVTHLWDERNRLFWWAVPATGDGSGWRAPTALGLAFLTWPGMSGHLLTMVMVLMISVASRHVRDASYELFWYVHNMGTVVFFVLLCTHALGGLAPPVSYKWVLGPLALYCIDRAIRIVRGYRYGKAEVCQTLQHPSSVVEVRMRTPVQNRIRAGQFVYICCPVVSRFEWHPFTVTSAPGDELLSVHLRVIGDWTTKVAALFDQDSSQDSSNPLLLLVDGGYGTPAKRCFQYKHVILICGDVDVMPFMSILRSMCRAELRRQEDEGETTTALERCDFFWVCEDFVAFEFFWTFLLDLKKCESNHSWLHLHIYFTSKQQPREMREIIMAQAQEQREEGTCTALQDCTHFGQPLWLEFFANAHDRVTTSRRMLAPVHLLDEKCHVLVFVCGAPALKTNVRRACAANSSSEILFELKALNADLVQDKSVGKVFKSPS